MNQLRLLVGVVVLVSCSATKKMRWPDRSSTLTGSEFYHEAFSMNWKERDSFVVKEILAGNSPDFLEKFVAVHIVVTDSVTGKVITAVYYAAPDYLSVGTSRDWARVNITPLAAQRIADTLNCFLPTR